MDDVMRDGKVRIALTEAEVRLLWLGTETLREANPDDPDAIRLDAKITAAVASFND
jgi:hypothetical protein